MNSVLNTKIRPTVLFDVKNKDHRRWAYIFLRNRTWSGCPYIFALPQSEPNVYTMFTRLLSEHYAAQEFEGVVEKPQQSRIRAVL